MQSGEWRVYVTVWVNGQNPLGQSLPRQNPRDKIFPHGIFLNRNSQEVPPDKLHGTESFFKRRNKAKFRLCDKALSVNNVDGTIIPWSSLSVC